MPSPPNWNEPPPGVALNVFYDRTDLIEACVATVVNALPITFLATFLIMGRAGISSNLMSLGGLVTSTILTLIVLPTIYEWLENKKQSIETEAVS